ncbi:MAG: ATP-binding protein [Bacteroidota bacterium]|nr:ATP-binding protein [Bacteroidota bacterium]
MNKIEMIVKPKVELNGMIDSILGTEQSWLKSCIASRIAIFKKEQSKDSDIFTLNPPSIVESTTDEYALLIRKHNFNNEERLLLALAMCNHFDPRTLNGFMESPQLQMVSRVLKSENGLSISPTAETFFFLVAGENNKSYLSFHHYFSTDHPFYKDSILDLSESPSGISKFDGALNVPVSYRELLLYNKYQPPRFSSEFPAHLLSTKLDWSDLVLQPYTQNALNEMKNRLVYETDVRSWETATGRLGDHMRPGMRVLLYGASGQGKTFTTALLGKLLNRDVYRIDLSAIISKYVGETSKNLRSLFDTAERKDWIIFIDEGDALLGMRADLSSSQSSTAQSNNHDVAYILQRIETFDGIIIVATNLANNIDAAFERRFEGRILYQGLSAENQWKVWSNVWPMRLKMEEGSRIDAMLMDNSLSPASIVNVVQRIAIMMAEQKLAVVPKELIRKCIMDEALKYKGRPGNYSTP